MNDQELRNSLNEIKPTKEQKERMLNNILKATEQKKNEKKVVPFTRIVQNKWVAMAASLILVAGIGISTYEVKPESELIIDSPQNSSDMSMRKFMNYNGYRYAFLEENATRRIQSNDLEKQIGKLEYQLTYDKTQDLAQEFATTYGVGGTIWQLKEYNPMFRVVVESDGQYYLCENVGRSNDSVMNLEAFLEAIKVEEHIEAVELSYKMDKKEIGRFEQTDSQHLFEKLKDSTFIYPKDINFEELYSDEAIKKIIDISFILDDATQMKMLMNLDQQIMTYGDNYYQISNELKQFMQQIVELKK